MVNNLALSVRASLTGWNRAASRIIFIPRSS